MSNAVLIDKIIDDEVENSRQKFPNPRASSHEGYAVIMEEREEMLEEEIQFDIELDDLWKTGIRADDLSNQKIIIDRLENVTRNMIKETIQVAAMIRRYKQDLLS